MKSFSTFVMMPFGANNEYIDGPAESDYIFKEIIEPGVKEAAKQLNIELSDNSVNSEVTHFIAREVDRVNLGQLQDRLWIVLRKQMLSLLISLVETQTYS